MQVTEDDAQITITTPNYTVPIIKAGFRYSFTRPDGALIAPAHAEAGIRWSAPYSDTLYPAATTQLLSHDEQQVRFAVASTNGDRAAIVLTVAAHTLRMQIIPDAPPPLPTPTPEITPTATASATPTATPSPTPGPGGSGRLPPNKNNSQQTTRAAPLPPPTAPYTYTIDAQLGAPGPGYGLGDHGGAQPLDFRSNTFTNSLLHPSRRFVSNFTVFPAQGFAQVLFHEHTKRVEVTATISRLGVAEATRVDGLYYFIGSVPEVYAAYHDAKIVAGYPDAKPKYAMFENGWEAYGSLGWNTNQANVTATVQGFIDRGYQLGWAAVGSRTWRGDPSPITAGTTRFGMWDDGSPGSNEQPRYPDPAAFKQFFRDNNMKLLIGLRINMDAENPFYREARDRGFFIADHEPLIDLHNPEALDWYMRGINLWGVDGFKEDLCCGDVLPYYDGKANPANEQLMAQGSYVIVRNSAYGVPGDLMRREDTEYNGYWGQPADLLAQAIAYSASAAPNYYPDIVGGVNLQQKQLNDSLRHYVVRNATIAAAMPAMSFGYAPWLLGEDVAAHTKQAAEWHSRYAPYIYSAAVDSFNTGFPHTLTALPLAYPDDPALYATNTVQWMLGPSLMAVGACYDTYATIGGDECTADVRLPVGIWIDPASGEQFEGPATLEKYPFPLGKIPVFVGGSGVLVERDPENTALTAAVYPVRTNGASYQFTAPDGVTTSTITNDNLDWDVVRLRVRDLATNLNIDYAHDETSGMIRFPLVPGHNYRLYTERSTYLPLVNDGPPVWKVYLPQSLSNSQEAISTTKTRRNEGLKGEEPE